jgi:Tol biopolymer transport system component
MLYRTVRSAPALALALLAACAGDQLPTEAGSLSPARGGNAATLVATPGALALVLPSAASGTITASVQFTGLITATTSDAACAVASPLNAPAMKPAGSSVYVATFTVTGAGPGSCTITLTDKRGGTATVQVQVREAPPVDGTKLVFSAGAYPSIPDNIFASNPDGSGRVQVTNESKAQFWPVLMPDRSKIVFASEEGGSDNLFMANLDGTGREQLTFYNLGTQSLDGTYTPAISPDGHQIAFALATGIFPSPTQIYVMDAVAGATPVAITAGNTVNYDPSYAPDGRIVFSSAPLDDSQTSIYVMAGNGASPTRLTTGEGQFGDRRPAVSPDGSTIAFDRNGTIVMMDMDGQHQRVAVATYLSESPVFSPDGAWLAFIRITNGNGEVMVLKLGRPESEALNITNSEVDESTPDWR